MGDKPLTPKQQRFVAEYLIDLNATQAAIRAGYSKHTANEQGSQLLAKLSVREAVTAGQASLADKAQFTAEDILRDLEEMRMQALACMQFGPAMKAAELRGKQIGMFVERRETTTVKKLVAPAEKIAAPKQWLEKHAPNRLN